MSSPRRCPPPPASPRPPRPAAGCRCPGSPCAGSRDRCRPPPRPCRSRTRGCPLAAPPWVDTSCHTPCSGCDDEIAVDVGVVVRPPPFAQSGTDALRTAGQQRERSGNRFGGASEDQPESPLVKLTSRGLCISQASSAACPCLCGGPSSPGRACP